MKKSVKSLLAFSLLFSTLSFNIYEPLSHTTMKKVEAAEEQASAVKSKTIDFVVNKDKSNEISYMDQYMVKPAKVYFENGKTYVEMTLKSASYWKSFELYDESGEIAIQTVKEDHQADTKVIKFKVKPGSQSLTSKVHIVVPAINYDNKYTTHVNFKEVIPNAPTTQNSNQQDTGKVDSNQSTTDQKQDNANQNNEDTQQAPAKDSNHEQPQTELPKQETPKNETPKNDNKPITKKEVPIPDKVKNPTGSNQGSTIQEKATSTLGYMVYKNGSSEISYMDQYMVKPARIVEENGKQYVELTLKSASYWKSFELFDHDKKLNVTTVSEDQSADTKIIRFEKPKYLKVLTSKVHIVVPAINYDNHYTTRIEFDKEAASGNVNTNTSDEQQPVSTPSKEDDTKGHDSTNVQYNQTTPSDDQKPESSNASSGANSTTNYSSSPAKPSNQAVTSDNNGASSTSADKASPSFNRNADGSTNMKLVNPSTSSSGDAMTYALIFSGAVLLLVGSFFLGKKRASK
ncbi:NEAT domain-containing protein [Mammaliicoccus sciuri]|uniref:NEAT domain-containing protein n=1 Tax=Mammaliicoccus sciuri TaxID=1296 RepID=UPI001FB2E95D|nr:NEAT domain-containing protein [Mammaliicoccus sciuri]MCJ0935983.1 NEAT domain-containing protein [Mammaliicoccus sciuri]